MSKIWNQWKHNILVATFIGVAALAGLTTTALHAQPKPKQETQKTNIVDIPGEGTVQEPQGGAYIEPKNSTPNSPASPCTAQHLAQPMAWPMCKSMVTTTPPCNAAATQKFVFSPANSASPPTWWKPIKLTPAHKPASPSNLRLRKTSMYA